MVEGWRSRSWAQLGQQQRSRSGFSTRDSARVAALERVLVGREKGKIDDVCASGSCLLTIGSCVLSLYNQQWLLPSISGLTFPEENPSALP